MKSVKIFEKWLGNRLIIYSALFLFAETVFAQGTIPLIHANSRIVDIKYGAELNKGAWHIDPGVKPDILTIHQSPNDEKRVAFFTDADSISFRAKAGHRYDFIILLNNKDSCYTQIIVLSTESVFMGKSIYVPFLTGILLLPVITYWKRKLLKTRTLLYTGVFASLLFWITTVVCGYMQGNYNHLSGTISQLGAIGTNSEFLFSSLIALVSILSIFFFTGLWKVCAVFRISPVPLLPILPFSIAMCGIAFFSQGNEFHGMVGQISILVYLGPLLAVILWKGEQFRTIRWISLVCFLIMLLIFLRFIPTILKNYEGLTQRFFHFGWTFWFASLSFNFIKLIDANEQSDFNETVTDGM